MSDKLLEPLEYYDKYARGAHKENLKAHFQELLRRSGVNAEENRLTVRQYKEALNRVEAQKKVLSKYKGWRGFLIALAIIGGVGIILGLLVSLTGLIIALLAVPVGIVLLVGSILIITLYLNKHIKTNNGILEKLTAEADKILRQAAAQMAPLNALFRDDDTFRVIEKTLPELDFDEHLTASTLSSLVENFDFCYSNGNSTSVTDLQNGRLCKNPFMVIRSRKTAMGTHTYTGTRTIFWTESYIDSEGKRRTRTRSQTLVATVTKPKPYYYNDTELHYFAEAAPDLTFSRMPQHSDDLSEKALERKIKKGEKKLRRKTEKSLSKGKGSFQGMTNAEFDVLFGALDRDNEVEFRIMYTPLAQTNTVELLTEDDIGYGDDFSFIKHKKHTLIRSEHAQARDTNTSGERYHSYDIDTSLEKFLSFNEDYFRSLFFDFAPLMSVPAYLDPPILQPKPTEAASHYSFLEHEELANKLGAAHFAHPASKTEAILKTVSAHKSGDKDIVTVCAHSYNTIPRTDIIPTMGGDGRLHGVPVHWEEYIPLSRSSQMEVAAADPKAEDLAGRAFLHGLMAILLHENK